MPQQTGLIKQNHDLILASTSPIRKKILQEVGLEFAIVPPVFDEEKATENLLRFKKVEWREVAMELAIGKALSVNKEFPNAYVIGSDQVCEVEGSEVRKSKNFSEAVEHLKKLSGKVHWQNNAVVVVHQNKVVFKNSSRVKLKMRKLTDQEISAYVTHEQSWGCAGSYQYEAFGKHLFEKVSGDYYSVLGLAVQPLVYFLHKKKIIQFVA